MGLADYTPSARLGDLCGMPSNIPSNISVEHSIEQWIPQATRWGSAIAAPPAGQRTAQSLVRQGTATTVSGIEVSIEHSIMQRGIATTVNGIEHSIEYFHRIFHPATGYGDNHQWH